MVKVDENDKQDLINEGKKETVQNGYGSYKEVDVDEFLLHIGQFGRTQILLLSLFCLIIIPTTYQTLIMSFAGNSPPWKCSNKSFESFNETFQVADSREATETTRPVRVSRPR